MVTYKNHALDEFLKHTIDLPNCGRQDLARIGGRCQDEELESCTLRNLSKSVSSSMAIRDKIQDLRREIDTSGKQLYEELNQHHESQCLSEASFLGSLTNAQLESLMVNGKINYQYLKTKRNSSQYCTASPQWIKNVVVSQVIAKNGSLSSFILSVLRDENSVGKMNTMEKHCVNILQLATSIWVSEAQHQLHQLQTNTKVNEKIWSKQSENDDEGDEFAIRDLEAMRLDAANASRAVEKFSKDALLFNLDYICRVTDFPGNIIDKPNLLKISNPWRLNVMDKVDFMFALICGNMRNTASSKTDLDSEIDALESLMRKKQQLEEVRDIEVLQSKKVIGATITGAAINQVKYCCILISFCLSV